MNPDLSPIPPAERADTADHVAVPRPQYERLVKLAAQAHQIVEKGPCWVTANDGDTAREFDPATETAAFHRFIKHHPEARTAFIYELSGDETRQLVEVTRVLGRELKLIDDAASTPEAADSEGEMPDLESFGGLLEIDEQRSQDMADEMESIARQQHQEALAMAADDTQLLCEECSHPALRRVHELAGVSLSNSTGRDSEIEPARVEKTICAHCGHSEETAGSVAARREAFCKLVAKRLLLDIPVDRRNTYTALGELYEQLVYTGALMLEMLQEIAEVIHNPDGPTFGEDGIFTGHFVLDPKDEWECEVYEQLCAIGILRNVGGLLYKPIPSSQQPTNPFASPMIDDTVGGRIH